MASSGTIGVTQLDVAKLIEKTYRRCGIPTGSITPELIEIAKENLFLLFNNFSNRGLNLWCISQPLIGLREHKQNYTVPTGTINILRAYYRTLTSAVPTTTNVGATTIDWDFGSTQNVVQFGVNCSADYVGVSYTFAGSVDGIAFVSLHDVTLADYTSSENYWYELNTAGSYQYYRLTISTAHTTAAMGVTMVSAYNDLPLSLMNPDDYLSLPNKKMESSTITQYMFERQMTPCISVWPVPNIETNCLMLSTHRQIQDVGDNMTATIEVPDRWLDAVSWEHASMCSVEVPTVPQERIQLCQKMAGQAMSNAEAGETDGSPTFLSPNISVYTR